MNLRLQPVGSVESEYSFLQTGRPLRCGLSATILLVLAVVIVCIGTVAEAANFAKGDQIELTRDTPLYFNEKTLIRTGKAGERFTVLLAQPDKHRVFVLARDPSGKELALSLADDSITQAGTPTTVAPPVTVPAPLEPRLNPTTRAKAMFASGGSPQSEGAVMRGLFALAKIQNPDGSWGADDKPAMTGLVLLAFVGHGETADSPDFGPNVRHAIDWVLETGMKNDGTWSSDENEPLPDPISHGILTAALAEYYTLTREGRLEPLLEKAIARILAAQRRNGGWGFNRLIADEYISVMTWQMQALLAARVSGLDVKAVDAALTHAPDAMEVYSRIQIRPGLNPRYCDIAAATFSCYLQKREYDFLTRKLDQNPDPGETVRDWLKYLIVNSKVQCPVVYKNSQTSLYALYCTTQAFFLAGGDRWDNWNRSLQPELIKNQAGDGTWPVLGPAPDGSTIFTKPTSSRTDRLPSPLPPEWPTGPDLQTDTSTNGSIYRTSLCLLMLEVYYRIPR